jgi:hypothetical protein
MQASRADTDTAGAATSEFRRVDGIVGRRGVERQQTLVIAISDGIEDGGWGLFRCWREGRGLHHDDVGVS